MAMILFFMIICFNSFSFSVQKFDDFFIDCFDYFVAYFSGLFGCLEEKNYYRVGTLKILHMTILTSNRMLWSASND